MWTHTYMCSSSLLLAREVLTLLYSVAFPERGIGLTFGPRGNGSQRCAKILGDPPLLTAQCLVTHTGLQARPYLMGPDAV